MAVLPAVLSANLPAAMAALMPVPRRSRRAAAMAVLLGVLLLHLWLVGAWRMATPAPPGQAARGAIQVLRVEATSVGATPPGGAGPLSEKPVRAPAPVPESVPMPVPVLPSPAVARAAPDRSIAEASRPRPAASTSEAGSGQTVTANEEADAEPATGSPGAAPPLYATRLPPSTQLSYTVRRGADIGEARLQWHQDVDRYAMQFDARLARGLPLIEQRSAGRLDDHGLAPERFTDRRRGRSTLAANFQRDTGRITFSGPRVEYPAWPGAQDRLGWIVQLAAIFSAAREPLNDVSIFVVGARGGAGLWTFRLQGVETVQTALGPVEALYLRREPERAEDQRVEAWLDPARGHWPVRLRSTPIRGGEPLELLLAAEPTRP